MTEIVASSLVNIVKFKIDMASYRRTLKAIDNVKAKLKSLNSNINSNPALGGGGGGPTPGGARQRINRVRDDARNFADAHVRARQAAIRAAEARNRRTATTDLYSQRFDFAAGRSTRLSSNQISQYRQQVQSLNAQFRAGTITGQQYREGIRQVGVTMRATNREALTMKERLRGMRSEILLFGLTAGAALKSITDVGSRFENTGIMMRTVFGEEAGQEMQFLREQTDRLGISLIDSVKTYAQLVFQAKEMGTSTQEMKDVWVGLGEASKVFGLNQEEMAGSFKAIMQMYSKGSVTAEELRQQLGEHLLGAYPMAAKALEISMLDLQAQMKKGLVKPSELVPKLIAIYKKAAQKGLKESLATFESYRMRFINSAQEFANVIYTNGLEKFARVGFTTLKQWLTLLKPVGREIGKIFDGLSDVLYTVQYIVAVSMDWMAYLGWLNDKTDETKDSVVSVGQVIGWAFGIGILAKFTKGLFGLKWAFGLILKMFKGPALAESIAGGLTKAGAEGGIVAGAARSAGTLLGGIFTTAFLAVWGYGIYEAAKWLGAEDLGAKLGNMVADSTVDYPAWHNAMGNTERAKNVSRWGSGDAENGWGAGRHVPQQPTKHTIEIEAVVKGDVVTQRLIDQISVMVP